MKFYRTMKNAINSLLDYVMQISEAHLILSSQIKQNLVEPIHNYRVSLSSEKEGWLNNLKDMREKLEKTQEKLKSEQVKLSELDREIGLLEIRARNNDPAVKNDLIQKTAAKREMENPIAAFRETVKMEEEKYENEVKKVLDQIENTEFQRIKMLKESLIKFSKLSQESQQNVQKSLEFCEVSFLKISEYSDIQSFIKKHGVRDQKILNQIYKIPANSVILEENKNPISEKSKSQIVTKKVAPPLQKQIEKKKLLELKICENIREKVQIIEESLYKDLIPNVFSIKNIPFNELFNLEEKSENIQIFLFLFNSLMLKYFDNYQNNTESLCKILLISDELKKQLLTFLKGIPISKTLKFDPIFSLYFTLLYLLKYHKSILVKESPLLISEELLIKIYKPVYCIAWAFIFWALLSKNAYKDTNFDNDIKNIINLDIFIKEYLQKSDNEQVLLKNYKFSDYTAQILYSLNKIAKNKLRANPLFSFKFIEKFIHPYFIDKDEKSLISPKIDLIFTDFGAISTGFGISPEWVYLYLMRVFWLKYAGQSQKFTDLNEEQNKGLRGLTVLIRKMNSIPLENRVYKKFDIYEKSELAGILLNMDENIELCLSKISMNFGKCTNKLKVVLGVLKIIHEYTNILENEDNFETRLKKILHDNGKDIKAIMEYENTMKKVNEGKSKENEFYILQQIKILLEMSISEITAFNKQYLEAFSEMIPNMINFYSKNVRNYIVDILDKNMPTISIEKQAEQFGTFIQTLKLFDLVTENKDENSLVKNVIKYLDEFLKQRYFLGKSLLKIGKK